MGSESWLEGHSSKDTNTRVDEILMNMHISSHAFQVYPSIGPIMKYWSLCKRLFMEVRPAIYREKEYKNQGNGKKRKPIFPMEILKNKIKSSESLIEKAKIPPEDKEELGMEETSLELLWEAHKLLYECEEDMRMRLQRIGFFYRPSGMSTPGIESLKGSV